MVSYVIIDMKPYGQKKAKAKLGIHPSDRCGCEVCNTGGWKVLKSRERHNDEEILDYHLSKDTVIDFCELEYTVKVRLEEDDTFRALSNVIDIQARAIDPDEALEKVANIFYKQNQI